jgi:hypothetical protein
MTTLSNAHITLKIDEVEGELAAVLTPCGVNLLSSVRAPLFRGRWRDAEGRTRDFNASMAVEVVASHELDADGQQGLCLRFARVSAEVPEVLVRARLPKDSKISFWSIGITTLGNGYLEWVQFPVVLVPNDLPAKGGTSRVFWPALEGVVIEDAEARDRSHMAYQPIEYPNRGWCGYYPGCAPMQFLAYYREAGEGLYFAAQDASHATKEIEYRASGESVELIIKTFPGAPMAGESWLPFETALGTFTGDWQDAAQMYREWALAHLPHLPPRLAENSDIPQWITDSPIVVTYPVTGVGHHSGPTEPNEYHPFIAAMSHLESLACATDSPLLALLMHWEGTAPWAPPYVWPPLGGADGLSDFARALHSAGHHLGLYCSGLAWTNTADTGSGRYDRRNDLEKDGLIKEMCRGPQGEYSCLICNGEGIRLGFDMCAASDFARDVTLGEVRQIASAGVDYIQLLDQNLGGAAYQCHDAAHGHPPAPGPWQTQAMRSLLEHVRDGLAEDGHSDVVLGCEAAAAESLLDHLPVNDLRFHMGWWFGRPVPALSFVFHEFCANFMGNQVEAMVLIDRKKSPENLFFRMAYSFSAGDMLTVVLADGGRIHWSWCTKWEEGAPEQPPLREFLRHLNAWRRGPAKEFLVFGRMDKVPQLEGPETLHLDLTDGRSLKYQSVLSSAWLSTDGKRRALIMTNYSDRVQKVRLPLPYTAAACLDASPTRTSEGFVLIPPREVVMAACIC